MHNYIDLGYLFEHVINTLRLRKTAPWSSKQTLADWCKYTQDEANELRDATKYDDIAEELGDVIADALTVAMVLETDTKGEHSIQSVLMGIDAKIKRRQPWIAYGGSPPKTEAEERVIWNTIKAQEAQNRAKLLDALIVESLLET